MAEKAHPIFSSFTKDMMKHFEFEYKLLERPKLKGKDRIEEKLRTDQLKSDLKGKDKNKYYNAEKNKYNTRYILDIDGNTITIVCEDKGEYNLALVLADLTDKPVKFSFSYDEDYEESVPIVDEETGEVI